MNDPYKCVMCENGMCISATVTARSKEDERKVEGWKCDTCGDESYRFFDAYPEEINK